jgi:hypothetical protein
VAFHASGSQGASQKPIHWLSAEECDGSDEMLAETSDRPWGLWTREVAAAGLYVNQA